MCKLNFGYTYASQYLIKKKKKNLRYRCFLWGLTLDNTFSATVRVLHSKLLKPTQMFRGAFTEKCSIDFIDYKL